MIKRDFLPSVDFVAKAVYADVPGKRLIGARDSKGREQFQVPMDIEDPVINETPLKDAGWATLFAYMHRRFGPPHIGGDDYKDLSAGWLLNSPHAEAFVLVRPSLSGPLFSFIPLLAAPKDDREGATLSDADYEIARSAYKTTLLDLLRPVCVRDSLINALGEVDEDDAILDIDEATDELMFEVERHPSCGYPMPSGLFGGDDWRALCAIIEEAGDGDFARGRALLLAAFRKDVFAELQDAPCLVRCLVGSQLSSDKDKELLDLLGLNDDEMQEVSLIMKSFFVGTNDALQLPAVSDSDVERAADYLSRLGIYSDLVSDIHLAQRNQAVLREWENCSGAVYADGGDFPDDAVPDDPWAKFDIPTVKRILAAHNRVHTLAWFERMDGKGSVGEEVVARVLQSLAFQKKDSAMAEDEAKNS